MKILKADELFSKFPNAFDTVSDDVKEKLLKYLETKVIHWQKKMYRLSATSAFCIYSRVRTKVVTLCLQGVHYRCLIYYIIP